MAVQWRILDPKKYNSDEYSPEDICGICRENDPGYKVVGHESDKITHFFHRHCVRGWYLVGNNDCPQCRQKIKEGQLFGSSFLFFNRMNNSRLVQFSLAVLTAIVAFKVFHGYVSDELFLYEYVGPILTLLLVPFIQHADVPFVQSVLGAMTLAGCPLPALMAAEKITDLCKDYGPIVSQPLSAALIAPGLIGLVIVLDHLSKKLIEKL